VPRLSYSRHLKLALPLLLMTFASGLQAQGEPEWLNTRVSEWYASASRTAPGQWGVAIADQSGRMLWSMNPD
jgi:hypothetical protein